MAAIAAEQYIDGESSTGQREWEFIQDFLNNFRDGHNDLHGAESRGPLIIKLVDDLRAAIDLPEAVSNRWQLASKTQLDSLEWLAWNELWYYANGTIIPDSAHLRAKNIREEEFSAQERLAGDIDYYGMLAYGTDGSEAYEELLASFHTARLLVKNPFGLPAVEKKIDEVALGQQLGAHQTVKALQYSGFSRARRSTRQEKDNGIDTVIPLGASDERAIHIRLQPGTKGGKVEIEPLGLSKKRREASMFVNIPYYPNGHSPFVMIDEARVRLSEKTKELRAKLLSFNPGIQIVAARSD